MKTIYIFIAITLLCLLCSCPIPPDIFDPVSTPSPIPDESPDPEETPETTPDDTPEPTPLTAGPIEDLTASLCEYVQEVQVSWSGHPQAEHYSVYGYDSVLPGASPVFLGTTDTTQYSDTSYAFEPGQFYCFYRVAWIVDGTEYGLPGPVSLGVTAPYKDYYEPNNDYTLLYDQPGSSVFTPSQPAVLYSIEDGGGGVYADTDWYKYHGPARFFSVEVTLHTETMPNYPGFMDYEVFVVFYYNQVYSPAFPLSLGENVCGFSNFGEGSGEVDVYFKIYPSVQIPRSVIGTYDVNITEGL